MGESGAASFGGGEASAGGGDASTGAPYTGPAELVVVAVGVGVGPVPESVVSTVPPHAMAVTIVAVPNTIAARLEREWGTGSGRLSVAPQKGQLDSRT
jgi:hypothetical protein